MCCQPAPAALADPLAINGTVTLKPGPLYAQHTWTAQCDGFHLPGPCRPKPSPLLIQVPVR